MTKRLCIVVGAALMLAPGPLAAQEAVADEAPLEVRVWLDRGDGAVLMRGDRVRLYYRTSQDAYVSIFHIDTDGVIRLLTPRSPEEEYFVRSGTDYRLLFPRSPYWFVDEDEGQGYFFAVASPYPLELGAFAYFAAERAWDLSPVGRTVYTDPYVAMDDYVAALIPDWETVPYALDFISYDVGATHDYPRFLCYDCHGFRSYSTWNPYTYACSSFRVVIWDDPYFYPSYRYGPTRVVFASPPRGRARFEFKERVDGEAWSPLTRTRQPPRRVQYKDPSGAAAPPVVAPSRSRPVTTGARARSTPEPRSAEPRPRPSTGDVLRRPGAGGGMSAPVRGAVPEPSREAAPGRRPVSGRPTLAVPSTSTRSEGERPVLQRRPSTQVRPPGSDAGRTGAATSRPSARVRGGTIPARAVPAPRARSGGTRAVVPRQPSARGAPVRPPSRSRPSVRSAPTRPRAPSVNRRPTPQRRPVVRTKPPVRKKRGGGGGL